MSKAAAATAQMPEDYSLDVAIEKAARALSEAKRVSAFTGAGMSAESGINTFRDPDVGVWKNRLALAMFGTPFGWRWTPGWAWSNYRRFHQPIFGAQPNAGHIALAQMSELLDSTSSSSSSPLGNAVVVATQNVDYLHQRAGSPTQVVFEIHGSIFRHRCIAKGHSIDLPTEQPLPEKQPTCSVCGSNARPDAVLFTENLPKDQWDGAQGAMTRLRAGDVLFVIGTSGTVQPAASLPNMCAEGVIRVEVNAEESAHTRSMDVFVRGRAAACLPRILERARELKRAAGWGSPGL